MRRSASKVRKRNITGPRVPRFHDVVVYGLDCGRAVEVSASRQSMTGDGMEDWDITSCCASSPVYSVLVLSRKCDQVINKKTAYNTR